MKLKLKSISDSIEDFIFKAWPALKFLVACAAALAIWWSGYRNVDVTKAHAPKVWEDAGYKIVGYEGYTFAPVHGSAVWYIVRKLDDNGITYHGAISKWGDEYHIYCLSAIDAIKP